MDAIILVVKNLNKLSAAVNFTLKPAESDFYPEQLL